MKAVNPWGAPPRIAALIPRALPSDRPVLAAVRELGPERCQWLGKGRATAYDSLERSLTCWALDGARATFGDLMRAARLEGALRP